ncbi:MAG: sterol desaturase family protein, partial [Gammaproteobacteria bacterium]
MPNLDHFLRITISWPTIATDELATAALLLFFIALSIAEAHCPEIHSSYGSKVQSYRTNIALFLLNSALLPVVSASSLWLLADLYGNGGLLKHVPGPVWKIVLAFLALDL